MSKQKRTMFSFFGPTCKQRNETVKNQDNDLDFNKHFFKKHVLKFVSETKTLHNMFISL